MKVLDLFSGIGGFSLGLERAGMETVAFCENEPFKRKVLKKHWPEVKIYNDITSAKFKEDVDMVAAGFPCQDVSYAGESAGITGERSGLYWHILKTLCMVGRPKLLLENVAALLNRGMGVVLGSLASIGYDAEWHCIPASRLGACHIRDRVWIIADPSEKQLQGSAIKPILGESALQVKPGGSIARWVKRSDIPKPRTIGGDDGFPDKVDRAKSLGDAVIPQIPEIIGRAIMEIERERI